MSLLLDQTRSKIDALLKVVEGLRALDYPFTDPTNVLEIIRREFVALREDLSVNNPEANSDTIKTICRRALESIENYLPVLGFLSRSSDLEAPVELHGPLLRLTCKALRSEALLVIFSEWNYSPFTFLFPELAKRGVVLVGMPRSESHNAFVAPLAGHELGHNVWQRENLGKVFQDAAFKIILDDMRLNWDKWKDLLRLEKPEQLTDLAGSKYWELPLTWAIRQCEETFCDLLGLLLFREAYLHAFRYLLAPGTSVRRAFHYPDLHQRATVLANAAAQVKINVPADYPSGFDVSSVEADDLLRLYVQLADLACGKLVNDLLGTAEKLVKDRQLSAYSESEVAKAGSAFRQGVPMTEATGIENILVAAWRLQLDKVSFFDASVPAIKEQDKESILNELVLKSFEVFEIENKVKVS